MENAYQESYEEIKDCVSSFAGSKSFEHALETMKDLTKIPEAIKQFDMNVHESNLKQQSHERNLYGCLDEEADQKRDDDKVAKHRELDDWPTETLKATWKRLAELRKAEFKEWAQQKTKEFEKEVDRKIEAQEH
eukprot:UN28338